MNQSCNTNDGLQFKNHYQKNVTNAGTFNVLIRLWHDGSITWMRRKLKRDKKKEKEKKKRIERKKRKKKKSDAEESNGGAAVGTVAQCKNSGSNSKANTNQPRHCSPMKARNFSGLIVLWNLISGEATPLDVVLLEKKKNIPSEDWTHIRNKKKKKSKKGCRKNIWKLLTPEHATIGTGQQS